MSCTVLLILSLRVRGLSHPHLGLQVKPFLLQILRVLSHATSLFQSEERGWCICVLFYKGEGIHCLLGEAFWDQMDQRNGCGGVTALLFLGDTVPCPLIVLSPRERRGIR